MSLKTAKGQTVLVSETVHPHYQRVIKTYVENQGFTLKVVPHRHGVLDKTSLEHYLSQDTASLIIQNPNFFGNVETLRGLKEKLQTYEAMLIACADPISLAILNPPGNQGADIVIGEGQSLGNPMNFGGPLLGFFASTKKLIRKMPGRIIGETTDKEGNRGFTLILQTREQHIRREKATSNITTNQAVNALAACIYLTIMGPKGLKRVANLCLQKANYAKTEIAKLTQYQIPFDQATFKEFVVQTPRPASEINQKLFANGIIGGLDLSKFYPKMTNHILISITEKRTKEEIDKLLTILKEII